jgi:hypothetical protein
LIFIGICYVHFSQTSPASPPEGSIDDAHVFLILPYAPPVLEPDPLKKYGAADIRRVLEAEVKVTAPAELIMSCAAPAPAEISSPPDTTSKLALSTPPDLNLILSIVLEVIIPTPVPAL